MVNEQTIRAIIQQILGDIDVSKFLDDDREKATQKSSSTVELTHDEIEAGEIPDITKIDIRTQYLVDNPKHGEEYVKLKAKAPCRLGIGKAGARYKTLPVLEFRAAHSAAQDAVFTDVDPAFIEKMGLFTIQSQCRDKDEYLTRPDLGRKLSEEGVKMVDEKCVKHPKVQIYIADGLSSAAIEANANEVYPAIVQGLISHGVDVGTPFFLKYGRVASMDQISEITGADVTCVLIGERPGLITAQSMSAYMAYKATVGMPEARRTVISNIHKEGTNPAEAGAHIADILLKMLETKSSGTDLKL